MYDRILLPTDGSDAVRDVADYAFALAETFDAELIVLNVADTSKISYTRVDTEVVDDDVRQGESAVEAIAEAAPRGVEVRTDVVQGVPEDSIVEYAAKHDADVVLMATHGREGLDQHVLGSVTERVLRQSGVPVFVVPPGTDPMARYPPDAVLVPVDDGDPTIRAIEQGVDLAAQYGSSLHLLHVVDADYAGGLSDVDEEVDVEHVAETVLDEALERVPDSFSESVTGDVRQNETVPDGIAEYARDQEIDVIAMGTHGRSGLDRYVLGSTTEQLLRTASVPVLAVPDSS